MTSLVGGHVACVDGAARRPAPRDHGGPWFYRPQFPSSRQSTSHAQRCSSVLHPGDSRCKNRFGGEVAAGLVGRGYLIGVVPTDSGGPFGVVRRDPPRSSFTLHTPAWSIERETIRCECDKTPRTGTRNAPEVGLLSGTSNLSSGCNHGQVRHNSNLSSFRELADTVLELLKGQDAGSSHSPRHVRLEGLDVSAALIICRRVPAAESDEVFKQMPWRISACNHESGSGIAGLSGLKLANALLGTTLLSARLITFRPARRSDRTNFVTST